MRKFKQETDKFCYLQHKRRLSGKKATRSGFKSIFTLCSCSQICTLNLFILLPRKTSSNPKHLHVNFQFDKVLSVHWRSKGPASWFCDWRNWKYECITWKTRAISQLFFRGRNTLLNFSRIHDHSPVDQTNSRAFSGCILKTFAGINGVAVSEMLEGPACFRENLHPTFCIFQ